MAAQRDANGRFIAGSGSGGAAGRTSVRIVLDQDGVKAILAGACGVGEAITDITASIAAAAGDGMHQLVYHGRNGRIRGQVWTGTYEARKAEAVDRALTRALDAGRR